MSQLRTRKKVLLCGIFALGTFTVCQTLGSSSYHHSDYRVAVLEPTFILGWNSANHTYIFRSSPQSSISTTASKRPLPRTGHTGISANPPRRFSQPTFRSRTRYYELCLTSAGSAASCPPHGNPTQGRTSDRAMAPASAQTRGAANMPVSTVRIARNRSTGITGSHYGYIRSTKWA